MRYSIFSLARQALQGHKGWTPAWRKPEPKSHYNVIIVGGGGHGLATAYYLAKNHGITNIAVLEKGYLGGGNIGRNTTIVRSNYMLPGNERFYEFCMKLWEGLEQELNFNLMMSQRGIINLAHSDGQLDRYARRGNAMRMHGAGAEMLSREQIKRMMPILDLDNARFPVYGGLMQPRAGTARHDGVAWGYARAADALGVDIIEKCEVTGIRREGGRVTGVDTTRGPIGANKLGLVGAGHTTRLAEMAGLRLPVETQLLQAYVTEGIKPVLDHVVTFGVGHLYISQSDKGGLVYGSDLDGYNSYTARGQLGNVTHNAEAAMSLIPMMGRLRLLRHWGGVMDMSMDGAPIISTTPIDGLYLNGGWCYGGFKAVPGSGWCFAHTMAHDEPHWASSAFRLDRFETGHALDEEGTGPVPNLH